MILRPAGWHSYTQSAMPIYEYRCENGHTFEVMQKMTDDPVTVCTICGAPVQRVFHPIAVHFKGKGFYNTDYGTKRRNREMERSGSSGDSAGGEKSSSASKDSSPSGGDSKTKSDSSSSDSKPSKAAPSGGSSSSSPSSSS